MLNSNDIMINRFFPIVPSVEKSLTGTVPEASEIAIKNYLGHFKQRSGCILVSIDCCHS
jgi:hypothetical protein